MLFFRGEISGFSDSLKSTATIAFTTDKNEDEENNVGSSLIITTWGVY